jgi:hypothetical protein
MRFFLTSGEMASCASEGITWAIEHAENDPYIRADGSVEITNWECRPWYDEGGEIGGLIVYTAVVTRQKKVEEGTAPQQQEAAEHCRYLQYPARNMQDSSNMPWKRPYRSLQAQSAHIYFYDEEKRLFTLNTWSDDVMKECSITIHRRSTSSTGQEYGARQSGRESQSYE